MAVGYYSCSGIKAAYSESKLGLVGHYLRHIQDVRQNMLLVLSSYP